MALQSNLFSSHFSRQTVPLTRHSASSRQVANESLFKNRASAVRGKKISIRRRALRSICTDVLYSVTHFFFHLFPEGPLMGLGRQGAAGRDGPTVSSDDGGNYWKAMIKSVTPKRQRPCGGLSHRPRPDPPNPLPSPPSTHPSCFLHMRSLPGCRVEVLIKTAKGKL